MVGIKDIAKAAGVSVSTVSNVLNGKKNVGEATRERILRLCSEMSYTPNIMGKNLKAGDTNTILFVFSDFDRSFYLRIINGISDCANEMGYNLLICTEKSVEKYMNSRLTSGCIILDERVKNDVLIRAASPDYPIVVIDRIITRPYIKSIVVNNYDSMTELVQRVVDCGYRRLGFLGGLEHTADNAERYQAFLDVLDKNNIPFHREHYYSGDYREKSGYRAAKIMMLSEKAPEALICANDNMAIGAIKAFREHGIEGPEDIGLTGFDDCDIASAVGLTTINIPNYERGYLAAKYLIENMRGKENYEVFKIAAKVKWRDTIIKKQVK